MCVFCVKATPKTNVLPPDHASTVSHPSVVGFCSPAPPITRTSHSDKSVNATAELPIVGNAFSTLENSQVPKSPRASTSAQFPNGTGLSMELRGVSLSPSRHVGLAEGCSDRFEHLSCEVIMPVKHWLDFEEWGSCTRSSKVSRKCIPLSDEPNVCDSSAADCVKSCKLPATAESDSSKGRPCKSAVVHASMPISVSESQKDPDELTTVTPVTQRLHRFLVCFYSFV